MPPTQTPAQIGAGDRVGHREAVPRHAQHASDDPVELTHAIEERCQELQPEPKPRMVALDQADPVGRQWQAPQQRAPAPAAEGVAELAAGNHADHGQREHHGQSEIAARGTQRRRDQDGHRRNGDAQKVERCGPRHGRITPLAQDRLDLVDGRYDPTVREREPRHRQDKGEGQRGEAHQSPSNNAVER